MTERLLQFIWQFRYFNTHELRLESGELIRVLFPGIPNPDQGADFLDARIRTDTAILAGNVELHIKASDWKKHGHGKDKNYQNIILHVVWENDGGSLHLPTIVLRDRVAKWRLSRYEQWRRGRSFVACEKNIRRVGPDLWHAWKEQLLIARLQRKSAVIRAYLDENGQHWEQAFWWLLASNFGLRVNAGSFEAIARTLPLSLLRHHREQLQQLESLLLGQAGLLERDLMDDYARGLQREYRFLKSKYKLEPIRRPVLFLRMRPGNFPTVRLAQLSVLLQSRQSWFALVREADSVPDLKKFLECTASEYWDRHYSVDSPSSFRPKRLSPQMTDSVIINTMAPMLFAYGYLRKNAACREKALHWLRETEGEKNKITRSWKSLGIASTRAADSQALIECKTHYCDPGNCLECLIGRELLRRP